MKIRYTDTPSEMARQVHELLTELSGHTKRPLALVLIRMGQWWLLVSCSYVVRALLSSVLSACTVLYVFPTHVWLGHALAIVRHQDKTLMVMQPWSTLLAMLPTTLIGLEAGGWEALKERHHTACFLWRP